MIICTSEETNSKKLAKEINQAFTEITNLNIEIKKKLSWEDELMVLTDPGYEDPSELLKNEKKNQELVIKEKLDELYLTSKGDIYFYFDCVFQVYLSHYDKRKSDYFEGAPDADELDFLKSEVNYFSKPYSNRYLEGNLEFNYNKLISLNDGYKTSINKKIDFLNGKLKHFGLKAVTNNSNWLEDQMKDCNIRIINLKVYSDTIDRMEKFYADIFIDKTAQDWFFDTLNEMNALDSNNNAKRGFQAICSAVFNDITCRSLIFKNNVSLKSYITYLNNIYDASIKSESKLSDGNKHINQVGELIKLYQNQL